MIEPLDNRRVTPLIIRRPPHVKTSRQAAQQPSEGNQEHSMSQVWLITGASRGLGRAIANAALAAGHSVVATSRNATFENADPRHRERLLVLPLDVTSQ